uniref:zinc ribbon domain-containing protein n=1 Tax=Actinoplanes derwentensis TaxID=113562 RepID=UPI0018D4B01C
MTLNVRKWDCPCSSHHDRDVNAAINIKAAGQADFNDRGAHVRPGSVPAARREAVTHPDAARSTRRVEGISVPYDPVGERPKRYVTTFSQRGRGRVG